MGTYCPIRVSLIQVYSSVPCSLANLSETIMQHRRSKQRQMMRVIPTRQFKVTTKEMDLMLLAGCSCLLTVLCHPSPETLSTAGKVDRANGAVAAQVSQPSTNLTSLAHLTRPANREEIQEEEGEA